MKKIKTSIGVISTFPKGAELWLTTFFNVCYTTYTIPIRLKFDVRKNKYTLETSVLRKVICITRLFFLSVEFLINFFVYPATYFPNDKGPLGVLFSGFALGFTFQGLCYLASMISSNTKHGMSELVTLIKDDKTRSVTKNGQKLRVFGEVALFLALAILTPMSLQVQTIQNVGLKKELQSKWYHFIELNEKKANQVMYSVAADYSPEDFPWWKGVVSFLFLLSELDMEVIMGGSSLILFVLMGKTLEAICIHFVSSIRDTQKFCSISSDEIIMKFWKIRRAFDIVSRSFGLALLLTVIFNGIRTCVGIVWMFRTQIPFSTAIGMVSDITVFIYFLCLAASASNQLLMVSRFLNTLDYHRHRKNGSSTSLRKLIVVHEITSGSVGLYSSLLSVISYGFIAGLAVTLMSNSALVLQYFDLVVIAQNQQSQNSRTEIQLHTFDNTTSILNQSLN
ncbi:unnamed protein product [Orchesella dallaii]|uniref:Gustatory receptor n=1 Tax=Orchesella dallaii TaxID=48710 RepID=A0ABP1S686_9HEXA